MSKSGGSLERGGGLLRSGGALLGRNPVAIGAVTAFLVVFSFISANALWYQPHAHPGPIFQTRPLDLPPVPRDEPGKVQAEERRTAVIPDSEIPRPAERPALSDLADPTVLQVQEVLSELRLYDGSRDGLTGPQTRDAVRQYQRVVGLEQSGAIDGELLRHLGLQTSGTPVPAPAPRAHEHTASISPAGHDGSVVMRIQGALKAFGNTHIEVDGIAGQQTEAAIREFQALFGLEVDGRPDGNLLKKMQDLGMLE